MTTWKKASKSGTNGGQCVEVHSWCFTRTPTSPNPEAIAR